MLCGSTVLFPSNGWEEFWYHLLEVQLTIMHLLCLEILTLLIHI